MKLLKGEEGDGNIPPSTLALHFIFLLLAIDGSIVISRHQSDNSKGAGYLASIYTLSELTSIL